MAEHMLTTIDNPYDPFSQWDEWYAFDESHGYHTCSYLARVVKSSDELSDADQELDEERAIEEIIQMNLLGIYKRVTAKE